MLLILHILTIFPYIRYDLAGKSLSFDDHQWKRERRVERGMDRGIEVIKREREMEWER